MDRIPLFGLPKQIDVDFDDFDGGVTMPLDSTCGLYVTLPVKDIDSKLLIVVKYDGEYGDITYTDICTYIYIYIYIYIYYIYILFIYILYMCVCVYIYR